MDSKRDYDMIVFGSSGVTGVYVIEEIVRRSTEDTKFAALNWAVAGRSVSRVQEKLIESFTRLGRGEDEAKKVQIIEAKLEDQSSLELMTSKTRLLLNCVGPYGIYGEQVIRACLASGTDYVDVTGEPLFMERIQLAYFDQARERRAHIVSACGFDSVPADIGVNYMKSQYKDGTLNSVETYLSLLPLGDGNEKLLANHATWDCIIEGYNSTEELKKIRKALFNKLYESVARFRSNFGLARKTYFRRNGDYCLPFPGSDRSVVKRSQLHNYVCNGERPSEMEAYVVLKSFKSVFLLYFFALIFMALVPFKFGRDLLHRYPEFFTYGVFTHDGPSRKEDDAYGFEMIFEGRGWSKPLSEPLEQSSVTPDKQVVTCVRSRKGFYVMTAVILVQCAATMLEERNNLPGEGGIWTPGIAFRKTAIIENLAKNGLEFSVISGN